MSDHVIIHNDGRVEIQSINPKIREFYRKNNLDYVPTAEDRAHALFDQKLNGEAKRHIGMMYKVKKGKNEYIYWWECVNGEDVYGNRIQKRFIGGKYGNPIGSYVYDEKSRKRVCTGIASLETVYDIPFDVKILEKLEEDGIIDENTGLGVDAGGIHYSVGTLDDFKKLSFDQLIGMGRTGLRPEQQEEVLKNRERKRTGQNVD